MLRLITRDFAIENGCCEDAVNEIADEFFPNRDSVTLEELENLLLCNAYYGDNTEDRLGQYLYYAEWVDDDFRKKNFHKISLQFQALILSHSGWVDKEFGEEKFVILKDCGLFFASQVLRYARWVTKEFGEKYFGDFDEIDRYTFMLVSKWITKDFGEKHFGDFSKDSKIGILDCAKWVDYDFREKYKKLMVT